MKESSQYDYKISTRPQEFGPKGETLSNPVGNLLKGGGEEEEENKQESPFEKELKAYHNLKKLEDKPIKSINDNGTHNYNSSYDEQRQLKDELNNNNAKVYSPLKGYIATSEEQYFYHPERQLWFDTYSGIYSYYDKSTQTYTPINDTTAATHNIQFINNNNVNTTAAVFEDLAIEQGEPGSDATLRLVVIESGILKSGDLVLVDANGISIGRDKCYDRRLRLAEMPTSKHHFDSGSQNGTFVNSKRLSESRMSSKPCQLSHMDELEIGRQNDSFNVTQKELLEIQRRLELNRLKRKYIGSNNNQKSAKYVDQTKIGPENKGSKLLQKMGWQEGQSLGCNGNGIIEPLNLVINKGRTGLGADVPKKANDQFLF
ncbi:1343_t:CDS:2 [Entrophospora sp. SA101]|nr:1343_t:CDS:2 [Entrophospora sp. SA101]